MKESRKIIFVGGVHGVGKGTLCQKISTQFDFEHLVASELIKWSEINREPLQKGVANINKTQDKLIVALDKRCSKTKAYLLDGHFCLFNKEHEPTNVPLDTFRKINPIIMLLIKDSPDTIKERLEKRDGIKYDGLIIESLQDSEISNAKFISQKLNCQLIILENNEYLHVIEKLKQII